MRNVLSDPLCRCLSIIGHQGGGSKKDNCPSYSQPVWGPRRERVGRGEEWTRSPRRLPTRLQPRCFGSYLSRRIRVQSGSSRRRTSSWAHCRHISGGSRAAHRLHGIATSRASVQTRRARTGGGSPQGCPRGDRLSTVARLSISVVHRSRSSYRHRRRAGWWQQSRRGGGSGGRAHVCTAPN